MGCQATELNRFTKPFKMVHSLLPIAGLSLTSSGSYAIDLSSWRVIPGLPGRSDLLNEGRLTRGAYV